MSFFQTEALPSREKNSLYAQEVMEMAGRPPKTAAVLQMEGISHKTRRELELRRQQEEALLTGVTMRENKNVRENQIAHAVFIRLRSLLRRVGKDDAIYEMSVNRYALLTSECEESQSRRARLEEVIEDLHNRMGEFGYPEYIKLVISTEKQITAVDSALTKKRDQLLAIEKESLLTVASALRNIQKRPKEEEADDPMATLLNMHRA